jgi:ligand-binding SRPBCC domain-containing protein
MESASTTKERAVGGKTSGLIGLGETVTWAAVHFGVRQRLTVEITLFERPIYFVDEMLSGTFKSMRHRHDFSRSDGGTLMKDVFEFQAPLWFLGWLAEALFLKAYMRRFLEVRNAELKQIAEGEAWRRYVPEAGGNAP